jgi:ABC-type antimicrobial peptide transport system permease subunit
MIYFCAGQRYRPRMTLHLRTGVTSGFIAPTVISTLHAIDRTAGLAPAETMKQYFDRVTLPQRVGVAAATGTALLELTLAVMALYGVIAFSASQRKREIGVRMALGASTQSVITLVMHEGLVLTAVGIVLGVGLALLGGTALRTLLIGVGPSDPMSFGGAIMVLLFVGAAASYLPARSVSRADPSAALRSE